MTCWSGPTVLARSISSTIFLISAVGSTPSFPPERYHCPCCGPKLPIWIAGMRMSNLVLPVNGKPLVS